MTEKLMTIDEVADYLSISTATLRNKTFRDKHNLHAIRVGRAIRFSREQIEDFISRNIEMACTEENGENN